MSLFSKRVQSSKKDSDPFNTQKKGFSLFLEKLGAVFSRIGNRRFTVMLIPHSERKVFNFKISLVSLLFIGVFLFVVFGLAFMLIPQVNGIANLLEIEKERAATAQANVAAISEGVLDIKQATDELGTAVEETKNALGMNASSRDSMFGSGGDLGSLLETNDSRSASTREAGQLNLSADQIREVTSVMQELRRHYSAGSKMIDDRPFLSPVEGGLGRITNYFGPESDPFGRQPVYMHRGLDFAYKRGHGIVATANGKVVTRKYDPKSWGYFLLIEHKYGYLTFYAHMDTTLVSEGDEVTAGQRIGTMGNSGKSTGVHLHYEIRISQEIIDPMIFLGDEL